MKQALRAGLALVCLGAVLGVCSPISDRRPDSVTLPADPRHLTIVVPDGTSASVKARVEAFQKSARLFERENAGVTVSVEALPNSKSYTKALLDRLNSGKPADLVFGPFDAVLAAQDTFADLLPLFQADKMTTDDLYKPLLDMATTRGRLIGLPMSPEPLAVFYNKEWFDKAETPYPRGDWTWEQFLQLSGKLKAANLMQGKEVYGSAVPMDLQLFESLARSSGQSVLSPDNARVSGYLDSRPVCGALALLLQHMNVSRASKGTSNSANAVYNEMMANHTGMAIGQSVLHSFFDGNAATKGKIGIAPLPRLDDGVRANALYFSVWSIVASSTRKELAWTFTKDVVLNGDSAFQKDWAQQDLLTSKAAIRKTAQHADYGLGVLFDELNAAIQPAVYRNPKLSGAVGAETTKRLLSAQSETEVQAALSDLSAQLDKQLRENP
ncbi:extracellular solute-binding protein [Paenibacillus hodogayensis]|uniref:Extracellular solute-binding protein n=1 Tax=Paenibacillus hodogayensis TaxID=279208 RepID=A0ABV5W205_9BACL